MKCRAEQTIQLTLLPQLQSEIDQREQELTGLRNSLSVVETKFGDLQQRLESAERKNGELREEYERKLEEAEQRESQNARAEVLSLQESNENLKMLLSAAEKKYVRLADLNNELQETISLESFRSGFKLALGIAAELAPSYSFDDEEEQRACEVSRQRRGE